MKKIIIISLVLALLLSGCTSAKHAASSNVTKTVKNTTAAITPKPSSATPSPKTTPTPSPSASTSPTENPIYSKPNPITITGLKNDIKNISTKKQAWYFMPNNTGTTPAEPKPILDMLSAYDGHYVGNTNEKCIYLTFDEGYENGYSSKILDTLKKDNVKAAFFVTLPYIKSDKELVKRMVNEGHIVGNHSRKHQSMPMVALRSQSEFIDEFKTTEEMFNQVTGKQMPKFFRPPMGEYSGLSLYYTKQIGYKSIFWSFAYADWDPAKQPDPEKAKQLILQRTHNGAIILLHAVSKTDTEILDDLIKTWRSKGYTFKTLDQLN